MEENFTNNQIFDLEIPNFEDLELIPVSRKYLKIIIFNRILFSFFLLLAFSVSYYFWHQDFSNLHILMVFSMIILLIVFLILEALFEFKYRKYAVREKDIVYQYGLIKSSLMIVPFNRIQHIKIEQSWLSKILQLKSITVFTAGINGGDISINGLPEDIAESINHLIMKNIRIEKSEDGGES